MSTPTASDIRTWAQEHGITVAGRGRLPKSVITAYDKAHSKPVASRKPKAALSAKAKDNTEPVTKPAVFAGSFPQATMLTGSPPSSREPSSDREGSPNGVAALELRLARLEQQMASLLERVDAAFSELPKRNRAFTLHRRK